MNNPLSISFNLPFDEAIAAAVEREVVLPDVYYGELQGIARQLAFSVAGLASLDQLQQVKDSLDKAMQSGESFNSWKKRVVEDGTLELPKHRLDNIFRTNLQGNYMAGKWEQFERNKDSRPYLMYDAINDSRVRPSHLALDGIIRRVDDPFWGTHSPPNGYRCRCSMISLTEAQAKARSGVGKGLNKQPILEDGSQAEPDKGWDYSPRDRLAGVKQAIDSRRNQCNGLNFSSYIFAKKRHNPPIWCDEKLYAGMFMQSLNGFLQANGKMPDPRYIHGVERLSDKISEIDLFRRFMREFNQSEIDDGFTDIIGNTLLIDKSLFVDLNGRWKIMKGGRAQWLIYTAKNIQHPDEIWLEKNEHGVDKLYYLSRFLINSSDILSALAIFERKHSTDGIWTGTTNFATVRDDGYIESKRRNDKESLKYWRWDR